ncbi:MAG: DUF484 family protein [Gammaproteobacteria bacterium]|nr:DUF484 family protein [Gammaproteobacteria bacterium]
MSTQRKAKSALGTIDQFEESQVVDFLKNQPDFFERHADLLAHLSLPHNTGAAVSLVERQASIMRNRNEKLDKKLRELVQVARTNQDLSDKTHKLSLKLMAADSVVAALQAIEEALRRDFGSERAAMVLFIADHVSPELQSNNFMRRVAPDHAALKPFATFMEGAKPRCGQIRDAQKDFLFGPENTEVGSAALLPVGARSEIGMLAIGNQDAHHFHPAMSTDFLLRLSQSVSAALARFQHQFH